MREAIGIVLGVLLIPLCVLFLYLFWKHDETGLKKKGL